VVKSSPVILNIYAWGFGVLFSWRNPKVLAVLVRVGWAALTNSYLLSHSLVSSLPISRNFSSFQTETLPITTFPFSWYLLFFLSL